MSGRVAICAFFKDEANYLKDWILFHLKQGVGKFFLYNNFSSDNYLEVLDSFGDLVSLKDWNVYPAGQRSAYQDALLNPELQEFDWVAFIDIDEFLFSPTGKSLPIVLEQYQDDRIANVCVCWFVYGANGETEFREAPIYTRFDMVYQGFWERVHARIPDCGTWIKSIVRPKRVSADVWSVHFISPLDKFIAVDEDGIEIKAQFVPVHKGEILRINHYYLKSYEEFLHKRKRLKGSSSQGYPSNLWHLLEEASWKYQDSILTNE